MWHFRPKTAVHCFSLHKNVWENGSSHTTCIKINETFKLSNTETDWTIAPCIVNGIKTNENGKLDKIKWHENVLYQTFINQLRQWLLWQLHMYNRISFYAFATGRDLVQMFSLKIYVSFLNTASLVQKMFCIFHADLRSFKKKKVAWSGAYGSKNRFLGIIKTYDDVRFAFPRNTWVCSVQAVGCQLSHRVESSNWRNSTTHYYLWWYWMNNDREKVWNSIKPMQSNCF